MSDQGTDAGFAGLHVSAFESRRATEMARLIERAGGVPHVSPSMREVPIAENRPAIDFANRVITGQTDIVIFMTGVGVRHLLSEVERYVDRARLLAALSDVTTVARGPKPVAVLKEFGLEPTVRVPEPNTWREVLATVDSRLPVAQQNVGLVEYGRPNASLIAGLEARGARVEPVRVYRWDLPEDIAPLADNLRAIAAGQRQVAPVHVEPPGRQSAARGRRVGPGRSSPRLLSADGRRFDWADHQRDACASSICRSTWSPSTTRWASWSAGRPAVASGAGRQAGRLPADRGLQPAVPAAKPAAALRWPANRPPPCADQLTTACSCGPAAGSRSSERRCG